jgi:hypothetical protein
LEELLRDCGPASRREVLHILALKLHCDTEQES